MTDAGMPFGPRYRTRWLSFRGWLAIQIKRKADHLSWWVNP